MKRTLNLQKVQKQILSKLQTLKAAKILVVGDVGVDQYVTGGVKRISPEAPVPVVEVKSDYYRLGLSTNVAQNIRSMGGQPYMVSVIGEDESGQRLQSLLKESSIDASLLIKDSQRPTTRKIRVMSGMHHIVRVDFEERSPISASSQQKILDCVQKQMKNIDGVILQDYAKGVLSKDLNQEIIGLCRKMQKPVYVDPNEKSPLTNYEGITLMTPNLKEACILAKAEKDYEDLNEGEIHDLGKQIQSKIHSDYMIITRSKDGMTLFEDGEILDVPTFAKQVYDVTGAGDTVISALSLAHLSGFSLEEACVFANFAAGIVVGKVGSATCTLDEIRDSMNSY